MKLTFDLVHYLRQQNLPKSKYFVPLFESVVNAFHAIKIAEEKNGLIEIYCTRERRQKSIKDDGEEIAELNFQDFEIVDNGIGFNETEYQAFKEFSTDRKLQYGGKGQGRFSWLLAFEKATIDSVYQDNGSRKRRSFGFVPKSNPIARMKIEKASKAPRSTKVKLINFRQEYRDRCPKTVRAIATALVSHCCNLLLEPNAPEVNIYETDALGEPKKGSKICLNKLLSRDVVLQRKTSNFSISGKKFKALHLLTATNDGNHLMHLCANELPVSSIKLEKHLPIAKGRLFDGSNNACGYSCYVSSEYLDENANTTRTGFDLPDDEEAKMYGEPSELEILKKTSNQAGKFLEEILAPRRESQERRFDELIRREPRYRPLRKYKAKELGLIPPDLTAEKYELAVFKIAQKHKADLRERGEKLAKTISKEEKDFEEFRKSFNSYLDESNDFAFADLATYVVDRMAVIQFLEARMGEEEGKFAREDAVHRIIFPLRKSSDDVDIEDTNLWLIDERLAFHRYLGSDQPFELHEPVDSDSTERADLAVYQEYFDNRYAFSAERQPFRSVTIVELKRPERDDYSDDDNPIEQVYRYIRRIEEGTAKDRRNNRFALDREPPYDVYIICHITPKLKQLADDYGFLQTPDGLGYYMFNSKRRAFVRIIDFWKLIEDAKKRNKAFFDRLNMRID